MTVYEILTLVSYLAFTIIVARLYVRKQIKLDTFVICYAILIVGAALCSVVL